MEKLLLIQMVFCVLFVLSVLLQKKSTWFSWALAWAYADNTSFYWSKRWFAKFLSQSSWVLAFLVFWNAVIFIFT